MTAPNSPYPLSREGWDLSELMTSAEVAEAFGVSRRTAEKWGRTGAGGLLSFKTPGGYRRYSRQQVEHILAQTGETQEREGWMVEDNG
jgi:transposase